MGYDANIQRLGPMALFDLKATQKALAAWCSKGLPDFPIRPNSATANGEVKMLFIGRDHWLIRAPLQHEPELTAALRPAEAPADISIVRISDTLTFFGITGPDAAQILQIASSLDVHPSAFAENGATFSEAFALKALIQRRPDGFCLAVEQSFGDMIEDYLNRALF